MRQRVFVLLCIVIHIPISAVWADSWNVELVGRETSGDASAVHVAGNYAYVTDMSGSLRVIDISDPSDPYEVGFCDTPGCAQEVYVSGSYAYVADGILRVIDISDPSEPREVGSCDTPAGGVYVSGEYAYVVGSLAFSVIDISDPVNPSEVASIPGGEVFHVVGNYAYVAGLVPFHPGPDPPIISSAFRVIDISNPANPHEVFCRISRFVIRTALYAAGNYVYLLGYLIRGTGVSNPEDESAVRESEGYDYTSYSGGSLSVIDISNPLDPRGAGSFDIAGTDIHVSGRYAYVTCYGESLYDGGLCVLDISNLENICEVGFYDTPGDALGVYVVGNYAYVADGMGGLCVLRYTGTNIESYSIRLDRGWNLISLPVSPLYTDLTWVMSPVDSKYKFIYSYDSVSNTWLKYITQWNPGKNSLHCMDTRAGYWIYMEDSMDLPIQGTAPNPDIKLKAGWNLVGYSSLTVRRAEDCMSSVADSISSVWEYDATTGWAAYVPGGPSNLISMRPGYGYWINADEDCTWDIRGASP